MTSGDYNGDGYEDFAATSSGSGSITPHGIWVFRGSEYGLIAPPSFDNTATAGAGTIDKIATTSGPYGSFPYIAASPSPSNTFATPIAGTQSWD